MTKKEILKPRLLDSMNRLKKFIEIDAPAVLIGTEAWNLFATTIAAYGSDAGASMIRHISDDNCKDRGLCIVASCEHTVPYHTGICDTCLDNLDKITEEVQPRDADPSQGT